MSVSVLRVENLIVEFERRGTGTRFFGGRSREKFRAVNDVSFSVERGKTLGVVGESGCGKSTLARTIMRLQPITSGSVFYGETDVSAFGARMPRPLRRKVQMVFQNPYASLNPRRTVADILSEPLEICFPEMRKNTRRERVADLLEHVGLSANVASRFPHEFSGGQRQRIAIARALATEADLVVCDEPVSALDVSVQAQIIALLKEIQATLGVAFLFIAHDLAVVGDLSDEILVMRGGKIIERGTPLEVFRSPKSDYAKTLLAAVPRL